MRIANILILITLLLTMSCYLNSGKDEYIIYISNKDDEANTVYGKGEIYIMNMDGSGQKRITYNDGFDHSPDVSPDGRKVVFHSNLGTSAGIYIMDADGSKLEQLTSGGFGFESSPTFTPDGNRIVYYSYHDDKQDISIMDTNGNVLAHLISGGPYETGLSFRLGGGLDVSPNGKEIVFEAFDKAGHGNNLDIYIIDIDGTGLKRLTNNGAGNARPIFSPDGNGILFMSCKGEDVDGSEIYFMNKDGSDVKRLTYNERCDFPGGFSRDGHSIVFSSYVDGDNEIYIMNRDGSDVIKLTDNDYDDSSPSFAPKK